MNLIYDAVGTLGTPEEFFQRLRDSGVRTLQFNPVNPATATAGWDVNQRDHRKLLIVDGRIVFLGGINISDRVLQRLLPAVATTATRRRATRARYRSADRRAGGGGVPELFLATWLAQKGEPLAPRNFYPTLQAQGKEVVRAIGSSPDDEFSLIYVTLLSAIGSAETEVWLTNAYFIPDPQLLAALKAAAARGVDVRLVLPGRTDSALVFHAGRSYYDQMLQDGVIIFERRAAPLHSKTAVIDGVWSTVGSTNFDWRSFLHNQEVNAVVLGTEFGDRMRASFAKRRRAFRAGHPRAVAAALARPVPQGMVFPALAALAVAAACRPACGEPPFVALPRSLPAAFCPACQRSQAVRSDRLSVRLNAQTGQAVHSYSPATDRSNHRPTASPAGQDCKRKGMGQLTTERGKAGYLASTLLDVAFRTNGASLTHATS